MRSGDPLLDRDLMLTIERSEEILIRCCKKVGFDMELHETMPFSHDNISIYYAVCCGMYICIYVCVYALRASGKIGLVNRVTLFKSTYF